MNGSENLYETLFLTMSEAVVIGELIYDGNGKAVDYRVVNLNPAAEKSLGTSKNQLINRSFRGVIGGINEVALAQIELVVRTGSSAKFEFASKHLNRHFSVVAFRPSEERFAVILQDVTDSRRALETLRSNEALFRGLFGAISSGVIVQDNNGAIIEANATATEILGLSRDELGGLKADGPNWHAIREDGSAYPVEEFPSTITRNTKTKVQGAVMGIQNAADGNYRWLLVHTQPVFSEITSELEKVVVNFVDITRQKLAEEALLQSRAQFTAFMDNLPGFAWIRDLQGRYLYLNKACIETLENKENWQGKTLHEIWPAELAAKFEFSGQNVVEQGRHSQVVELFGQETEHSYLVTRFPITDHDPASPLIGGIALDGSETQRKIDQLRKKHSILEHTNQRLEAEISVVSEEEQRRIAQDLHDDVCQNLVAISLLCSEHAESLAETNSEGSKLASRLEQMICGVLNDSRNLARGLHALTLDNEGLTEALKELAKRASVKVPCKLEIEDTNVKRTGKVALGLYRIAQEAVSNSLKHSEARQIVIRLQQREGLLSLSVSDNGNGKSIATKEGMGIHIMGYRARMIGGDFKIKHPKSGGTEVHCTVPDTEADVL